MTELEGSAVPPERVRNVNRADVRRDGGLVLYWMTAFRRLDHNFALERAVEWARELGRPLVVLEALRSDYRWASDRLHRFVLDGMEEHARRLEGSRVRYLPYVEPEAGAGEGLLEALAHRSCVVVADDFPTFFLPRMLQAAAEKLDVRLEAVDANGLLPMRATDRVFKRAQDFRRFLQHELPRHLDRRPREHPLTGAPLAEAAQTGAGESLAAIEARWPPASGALLAGEEGLEGLPIDHEVPPVPYRGGARAARKALDRFLEEGLPRYASEQREPEAGATSGLSPWLHFGHLSAHEVFGAVAEREGWGPADLADEADGSREGWWGMSPDAEAFLEQLVTWRELGFNRCALTDDYDRYTSLPDWARETLEAHADDPREHLYSLEELEAGATHDPLWNAAQGQLLREGRIHNYLRMLWGKNIVAWTESPRRALRVMIELNDRWAVDGRDPNSYSGISWCLGRYDRPWPEREVFGKVRSMTSASTRRKLDVDGYVEKYAP